MSLAVRPGIMDIAAYVPGEHDLPGSGPIYKMSSNESALGASQAAMAAYAKGAAELHRYPDGASHGLRAALAKEVGGRPDEIICGTGSDDILVLLTRAYAGPGDEVLYSRHGFLIYPIAAQSVGAEPVTAPEKDLTTDVDALLAKVSAKTKICFVANPNNPTGSYIPASEMRRLREKLLQNVLLVVDAAYAEYVDKPDYTDGSELVKEYDNVVVSRTFSKIYGLAAVRLGWAYGQKSIIEVLQRIRGVFNVGAPAQLAGIAAIADTRHVEQSKAHNDRWMPWFVGQMKALGLHPYPTVTNFVLVRFPSDPKLNADAAEKFLKSRRVLVRKMGAYGLPDCLRITIAEEAAVKACAEALADFVAGAATQ